MNYAAQFISKFTTSFFNICEMEFSDEPVHFSVSKVGGIIDIKAKWEKEAINKIFSVDIFPHLTSIGDFARLEVIKMLRAIKNERNEQNGNSTNTRKPVSSREVFLQRAKKPGTKKPS